MEEGNIKVRNAHVNNLKGIDVEIPRGKFVVVTGLSGSGKSSLAFNTLYAEGQRRYVESLSAYARQFMGKMKKPDCDSIEGLPPTIAIEQKVTNRNPRSTVGTMTEIWDYMRLLYARIGKTYSPISGELVKRHTPQDLVDCMLNHQEGQRFLLLSPVRSNPSEFVSKLQEYLKEGYARIEISGQVERIQDVIVSNKDTEPLSVDNAFLVIDRLAVDSSEVGISRLLQSAQTAFYEGQGTCLMRFVEPDELVTFSNSFSADGIDFQEPTEYTFSFNSPMGACPVCEGFGRTVGIDPNLVIPHQELSVYDGAVQCWRGDVMSGWKDAFIEQSQSVNFPVFTPYFQLTQKEKDYLWHGDGTDNCVSIDSTIKSIEKNQYKVQFRAMLSRYKGKTTCTACGGHRLKPQAEYVKIAGKSITELADMPLDRLQIFFSGLEPKLEEHEKLIARRLLFEINRRLELMLMVGLGYLTLNRSGATLSGGEGQRINIVKSIGSSLVGSLYVLDEPSIGLHSRDTQRLIQVIRALQQAGNTVIVVEHDGDIIRAADWMIEIGPAAGRNGGNVMYSGPLNAIPANLDSYTAHYLRKYANEKTQNGHEFPVPRSWNNKIVIRGARQNNLKNIDVTIPLNVLTVVTGVSGSGKTSLVRSILYNALLQYFGQGTSDQPGSFTKLEGDMRMICGVEFVNQESIGHNSRSNPVTYVRAYDEIRHLFADQPLAAQMGFKQGFFSFNSDGGRCDECKGDGVIQVPMQFMSDMTLECPSCHGKRFKPDVLEVTYNGCNVWDILEMTVNQAIEFFNKDIDPKNAVTVKHILKRLASLQRVGLGYIKLGQSSNTLSGGENQRVKLAYYLSQEKVEPTMFIFDEPTTGLHYHDIETLMTSFDAMISRGHTIVLIEHNIEVISRADYIVDLGPEGGDNGGDIVVCGTPQQVMACKQSYTGEALREM